MKRKKILFLFGGVFCLSLFTISLVHSARIAITPLVFELSGERGEVLEQEVRVMNPSTEETITVVMESEDIFPEGEEGRVRLEVPPEERTPFSLAKWISFEPRTFTLNPREEKPVKFRIKIPDNAEPGGHYAGVIARIQAIGTPEGTGVGIVPRVASLVLLKVGGKIEEKIKVVEFDVEKRYSEKGPIKFILRLENQGTIHVKPTAKVIIKDLFGRKIDEISFEARTILPNSTRKLETQWKKEWLFGGKYEAILRGFYGEKEIPLEEKKIIFFVFPWKLGLLFGILVVFFILTRKRWKRALEILIKGEKALKE